MHEPAPNFQAIANRAVDERNRGNKLLSPSPQTPVAEPAGPPERRRRSLRERLGHSPCFKPKLPPPPGDDEEDEEEPERPKPACIILPDSNFRARGARPWLPPSPISPTHLPRSRWQASAGTWAC